ncbi:MAG: KUP/HAK/KT family potassium transporter [Bacteroidales bacterium]
MKITTTQKKSGQPLRVAGLLITLGIVFGDIGTSPLYVVKAIAGNLVHLDEKILLGVASCIFWTLTLQTTIKYVVLTLRASNKGEGGIFALYALIRRNRKWAYLIAIIGGSTLLADGIITPSITVSSAVEGLRIFNPEIPTLLISVAILSLLFFAQQFGTVFIGRSFGPVMFLWFTLLGILGLSQVLHYPDILRAFDPLHAVRLIVSHPQALLILGAVFLATTGAEALYSDLGHCGAKNIRISWAFVKSMLVLNYFGQTAWLMHRPAGDREALHPFFDIMPEWFLLPGIIIATLAAIIASQALISGSFTLVSEAISLGLWPKQAIKYPSESKGQMYIPAINRFLWVASTGVLLLFKESSAMEAAYGLSISIAMMMTTVLLLLYLLQHNAPVPFVAALGIVFGGLEILFLAANLQKFAHGGWFALSLAFFLSLLMFAWYRGGMIKNNLTKTVAVDPVADMLLQVKRDQSIPKFATNLVYLSKSGRHKTMESTIAYSLLDKQPKRADIYWFLHIDVRDEPYVTEYEVYHVRPGEIIRVNLSLGFKVQPRVNLLFRKVLADLAASGEIQSGSRYPSLQGLPVSADCRYILLDRVLTADHTFPLWERFLMNLRDLFGRWSIPPSRAFHIDASNYIEEKVPLGTPDTLLWDLVRRMPPPSPVPGA